jgi:hypothetical protein
MKLHLKTRLPWLAAALLTILSCASPLTPVTVAPPATGVALTLQALASVAPPLAAASPTPARVLPRALYFLARDNAALLQIFRLDVDGRSIHQITFEPTSVEAYDVSPKDSSIAYVSDNRLFLVDSNGGGRQLILDGGPLDENNRWTNGLDAPAWSPDGQTLAYGYDGLNILALGTGDTRRVLENQVDTSPGFPVVGELYVPNTYSPDGSRLLVNLGYQEGGTYGVYAAADGTFTKLQREDGGTVCCHVSWIPDGSGLYIASPSLGMIESGLFYADATSGSVIALLPGAPPDGTYNFADAAKVGPDGKLYFFFNNLPEIPVAGHTPLFMVRAASDGLTDRTRLLPDAFPNVNEILWAPDATLAVLVLAPDADTYAGGQAAIVYPDGRPNLTLVPSAQNLRWGS